MAEEMEMNGEDFSQDVQANDESMNGNDNHAAGANGGAGDNNGTPAAEAPGRDDDRYVDGTPQLFRRPAKWQIWSAREFGYMLFVSVALIRAAGRALWSCNVSRVARTLESRNWAKMKNRLDRRHFGKREVVIMPRASQ